MEIKLKRKAFENWWEKFHNGRQIACDYVEEDNSYSVGYANAQWVAWQAAKADAVPEGFVLVQKSKINILYQDSDDPENFCRFKDDFNSLGGCIDGDEIMVVDIHESTQIGTKKAFGVWRSKSPIDIESDFVLVESREEAEQILIANKAMLEAQEQSHD